MTRLLVDALFLDPRSTGGPATYLRGLLPAMARARPGAELLVATTRRGAAALRSEGWGAWASVHAFPCDEGDRLARQASEQVLLPWFARRVDADAVFSPGTLAVMRVPGCAHVLTVHDVTFFHERTFNPVTTAGMRFVVRRCVRHADSLLTVSEATRREIVATLGVRPRDLPVVHNGVELPTVVPAPLDAVRERHGIGSGRFVLCVGAKRPHKNQEVLIAALEHLPDDVRLVLAGHPEPYEKRLRELAAASPAAERVHFCGWLDEAELEALWRGAAVVALPTRAEGFGLPLVEALARGAAVACSDIPVLREVGGDVPRYVAPRDPAAWATALGALLDDPGDAAQAGPRRAAVFTWDAAAAGTWAAVDRGVERFRSARR